VETRTLSAYGDAPAPKQRLMTPILQAQSRQLQHPQGPYQPQQPPFQQHPNQQKGLVTAGDFNRYSLCIGFIIFSTTLLCSCYHGTRHVDLCLSTVAQTCARAVKLSMSSCRVWTSTSWDQGRCHNWVLKSILCPALEKLVTYVLWKKILVKFIIYSFLLYHSKIFESCLEFYTEDFYCKASWKKKSQYLTS